MATRRVVTGINQDGKSYFVHDGPTPGHLNAGYFQTDEIWVDEPNRPDPKAENDPVDIDIFDLSPPVNGSRIRIFTFPSADKLPDPSLTPEEVGKNYARWNTGKAMETDDPAMHTTATIDYGIVLQGEIFLELDEGEVHLKPGDVVVQRGTRHAWRNRGQEACTMAFILISSQNYQ